MKIFVFAPNYTHQSGGIEAMHYLMYLLERAGHSVVTSASVFNPAYDLQPEHRLYPALGDDMIIAPEIISLGGFYELGLPILRWVLYFPGGHGGPDKYPKQEIVYHYQKNFAAAAAKASFYGNSGEFFLPHLVREEFEAKNDETGRNGDLYFVHKGVNMKTHPETALEINRSNTATRREYLKLLREHKTLYCYDRNTYLAVEAHLSGMKVLLWNYDNKSWENILPACDSFRDCKKDTATVKNLIKNFNKKRKINALILRAREIWEEINLFFKKKEK